MIRGIYCSNTGLNAMGHKMNTIADNLANVNTEGFKQERAIFKDFINEAFGVVPDGNAADLSSGSLIHTGRECDFAIEGDAFFKVKTAQGDRYTAYGSFRCDEEGYLTDKNGNRIAGVSGDVRMENGKPDQEFALVTVKDKGYLIRTADGFMAAEQTEISEQATYRVIQGKLESSNVDLIYNLSEMIAASRYFSLNSKMIMSQDEILKKAAEEIGALK